MLKPETYDRANAIRPTTATDTNIRPATSISILKPESHSSLLLEFIRMRFGIFVLLFGDFVTPKINIRTI